MSAEIVPLDYGMPWTYNDGGRSAHFKGRAGDCAVRSIAIATGREYRTVYNDLFDLIRVVRDRPAYVGRSRSPRTGVPRPVLRSYLDDDFVFTPTMSIGSGCRVHLRTGELPPRGFLIVSLSKHVTAVIDGVVHDTFDPSRRGTRCVYGYYTVER